MKRLVLAVVAALMLVGTPAAATTIASLRTFPTTDGDVLATAVINFGTYRALAIGGHFNHIKRNGQNVAAKNVAILRIPDGAVLYAGRANGYVKALHPVAGRLYIGGTFTSLDGKARNHIASVSTPGWKVTPFNPGSPTSVTAITATRDRIVYGSGTCVRAAARDSAAVSWSVPVSGGAVRVLLAWNLFTTNQDAIYVGGLFEQVGNLKQHGLMRVLVRPTGPVMDRGFAPRLLSDGNDGSGWKGQEILSLAWQSDRTLMYGWGGGTNNGVGAMRADTGGVWWSRYTDGDVQGIAIVGPDLVAGWHRNHVTSPLPGRYWAGWFGGSMTSRTGRDTAWNPRLIGNTGDNSDGGNGGIQAFAYDQADGLLFVVGAFTGTGDCSTIVWPCTAPVAARQSVAVYGVAA